MRSYFYRNICLHVKCRIHAVNILLIQLFPKLLQAFSKSLEMHQLSLTQELNDVVYIRVIR